MGTDDLWLMGDNFMASTYRKGFKKAEWFSFIKTNYEVGAFCSSKYKNNNTNAISRIVNTFVHAFNSTAKMPKYIIVILDDDLIQYLKYKEYGVSTMYGTWIEYLVKQLSDMIDVRGKQLPIKAKQEFFPTVYWTALPSHEDLLVDNIIAREKFNKSLESVVKITDNM